MKKIFTLFLILTLSAQMKAQFYFDITAKTGIKSTWMTNLNIKVADSVSQEYARGWSGTYGIGFTPVFRDMFGLNFELLYTPYHVRYYGSVKDLKTYYPKIVLNQIDIPTLFTLINDGGAFLEAGPMFSFLSKATFSEKSLPTLDVTNTFNKINVSAIIGFGFNAEIALDWYIKGQIRFEYALTNYKGVDAFGREYATTSLYTAPEITRTISGGIHLGIVRRIQ